jgi:PIN domain nuclease of toxin-antitoxin system
MSSVVVDTHTIIWYLSRSAKISLPAVNIMDAATASNVPIFIASITLVEMIYLVERNRIPADSLQDLKHQLTRIDSPFTIAPLTAEVAQSLSQIPRDVVPDMPDRIIAATAHHLQIPLVTCDHKIRACSVIQTIW